MARILVTGANGQVGTEVVAELERRATHVRRGAIADVIAAGHDDLDVSDRDAVMAAVLSLEPEFVIHLAAFTAVDSCETESDRAWSVNALGTRHVAEAARLVHAHVGYVSTDYVFDGTLDRPYTEWDEPNPLSCYGRSKLAGERELGENGLIVRSSWLIGRNGSNFAKTVLRMSAEGLPLRFVSDQRGSPTVAHDLARRLVSLVLEKRHGLFHVTNQGATSWYGLARAVLAAAGEDPERVEAISTDELDPPRAAERPANSVLDNAALRLSGIELLPEWEESTAKLVSQLAS
ncbi:MAG TPA: dTDP-4-dehydrorhamnose reductase [Acidimicrobiales bacterium]|nr:dTDP-4-dehydrorhamnose reductase [Acidimicrobiales bacterium]